MDEHTNFDQTKDALVTIFTNCIVALDGIYVSFMVRSFELWDDKWWKKMDHQIGAIRMPEQKLLEMFVDAFDVVISVSGVAGTDKLVPQLWQNFAVPV